MRAVVLEAFGGPENLRPAELPDPAPGPGQAVVRVRACALNHLDLWVREGIPAYRIKLPHLLGCDVAGVVESVGPQAAGARPGDRVAVHPGRCCGACPACREGREPDCPSYGIIGAQGGPGGYAERLLVPAEELLPLPEGLGFVEAASLPLTALTAWHMLSTLAEVRAGQTVVVVGAGSGMGTAGIQVAKALGARVVATTSDPAKVERARALGADAVVLHPPEDLPRAVRKATGGAMADAVLEHVGPAVFDAALKCLRPSGRLITCGATSGPETRLDLRYVFSRQLRVYGAKMGSRAEMRAVWELVRAGKVKPVVDRTYPLSQAREAHERLASRGQFGKVVLEA